jgi:uncharacterized protein
VRKDNSTPAVIIDYNIAQLLKQQTGVGREYTINQDIRGLDAGLDPVDPLVAKIKLIRTKSGVLLALDGSTSLRVLCSRCLDPVVVPVTLSFAEEFLQTVDITTGFAMGTSEEDPSLLIDGHHDLHLANIIREYLLMAVPMHPLCHEDCKGLCPVCGHNLNLGPCGHSVQPPDDRWSSLKSLLDK